MDAVIILILLAITGSITAYLVRQKKRGSRCPGCSCSKCSGSCQS